MKHSRLFETGNAEWSEFRLTTTRGLAQLASRCFWGGKAAPKTIEISFRAENKPFRNF